ncbi:fatty acid desaturase [Fimbriiglobus ruber]|uniref:Fatty acid desaturase n=1 Tax=Fimbriiglobus ruber TaxID=1908690 RepID=A0A225DE06_9BACT|nr:fatty acid desaturase [Fimbriiglobus ruber]OWK39223.1 Fatty acid desaturase [Fimbriiglobus ruber]
MAEKPRLPSLRELGIDLLRVPRWRVAVSVLTPFVLFGGYFVAAGMGYWLPAVALVGALSFVTYGSVSHDLVHSSLRLPRRMNDLLLSLIEGLMLRSGRAYRLAHLHHHAHFPDPDDPEARAAHGSLWAALCDGPKFAVRLWVWAWREHPEHRARLAGEAVGVIAFVGSALALAFTGLTVIPLAFVALAHCGSWAFPLATAYLPHDPAGATVVTRTRMFRGIVARVIALDHLYHLEHHLYPAVPHHQWAELGRRLTPHLIHAGAVPLHIGLPFPVSR